MFQMFMAVTVGGILAMVGYGLGAAFTDDIVWSLAFAAVAFAIGVAMWAMLSTKAHEDEHPSSTKSTMT